MTCAYLQELLQRNHTHAAGRLVALALHWRSLITCDPSTGVVLVEVSSPGATMSTRVWDQAFDAEHAGFNMSQAFA